MAKEDILDGVITLLLNKCDVVYDFMFDVFSDMENWSDEELAAGSGTREALVAGAKKLKKLILDNADFDKHDAVDLLMRNHEAVKLAEVMWRTFMNKDGNPELVELSSQLKLLAIVVGF